MPSGKSLPENPTVQLWSPYLTHESIRVDSSERTVQFDGISVGRHPNFPVDESELQSCDAKLLAFSAFESWSLSDHAKEGRCEFTLPPKIDREAFLRNAWGKHDIVHLSSHGEAFAEVPDATNVLLGCHTQARPPRFHYNDVIRLDFSGVSLVVLNVCMTKYGIQWANDDDLAREGVPCWTRMQPLGASPIPFTTRCSGAKSPYETHLAWRWLTHNRMSFKEPDIWGAFALLD